MSNGQHGVASVGATLASKFVRAPNRDLCCIQISPATPAPTLGKCQRNGRCIGSRAWRKRVRFAASWPQC